MSLLIYKQIMEGAVVCNMQRDADMRFIENDLPYLPTEQCMRLSMMHG
jgi:hypothetical protein